MGRPVKGTPNNGVKKPTNGTNDGSQYSFGGKTKTTKKK